MDKLIFLIFFAVFLNFMPEILSCKKISLPMDGSFEEISLEIVSLLKVSSYLKVKIGSFVSFPLRLELKEEKSHCCKSVAPSFTKG